MLFFKEMLTRVTLSTIAIVVICLLSVNCRKSKRAKYGPTGMSFDDTTNCSEFSKFGRFNPYSVLNEKWFVFYYWAPIRALTTYIFAKPSANHTKHLKRVLKDEYLVLPVMWSARLLLMEENNKLLSLLVERGDRGEYWLYPVVKVPEGARKITPRDIRMKQTGDNRILGLMDCELQTLLVMAKLNDVPPKRRLYEEAARLGFRGRRGKSYLYQGHEWGPVGEEDEKMFWDYRSAKKISKKETDVDKSNEEVELQSINKPEDSQEEGEKEEKSTAVKPTLSNAVDPSSCVRLEPELWNDPAPRPTDDSNQLSKQELDNLVDTDLNNTLTIKTPDSSQNDNKENNVEKKIQNTEENNKVDPQEIDNLVDTDIKNTLTVETDGSQNVNQENNVEKEIQNTDENNKVDPQEINNLVDTDINNTPTIETPDSSQNVNQENNVEKDIQNTEENNKVNPQEIDNLVDTDINHTLTVGTDGSQNVNQENIVAKEIQNTEENNKIDTQDINKVDSNEEIALHEPEIIDSVVHYTEDTEMSHTKEENCEVCFQSTVSAIVSTNGVYLPENSRDINSLVKDEKVADDPHTKISREEKTGAKIPQAKVSAGLPVHAQDLKNSSGFILAPIFDDVKS